MSLMNVNQCPLLAKADIRTEPRSLLVSGCFGEKAAGGVFCKRCAVPLDLTTVALP